MSQSVGNAIENRSAPPLTGRETVQVWTGIGVSAAKATTQDIANLANPEAVNPVTFGAKGDLFSVSGAISIGAGVNQVLNVAGATFTYVPGQSAIVPLAGTAGGGIVGTITAASGNTLTLAGTTGTALTSIAYMASGATVATPGTGVAPGDTFTLAGGVGVVPTVLQAVSVLVVSATVVNGGTGGTPGAVTITGTTAAATPFSATGTINGSGILTGALVVTVGGWYPALPPAPTAEPVVGGGLVGATVSLAFGVHDISPSLQPQVAVVTPGGYSTAPSNPVSVASTSGVGSGVTFNLSWAPPTIWIGTDDAPAINAAIAYAAQNNISPGTTLLNVEVEIPANRSFLLLSGLDCTLKGAMTLRGNRSVLYGATNGTAILDFLASSQFHLDDVVLTGDPTMPPSFCIQFGAVNTSGGGGIEFAGGGARLSDVSCGGTATTAGIYCLASEVCSLVNVGVGGNMPAGIILDGGNSYGVTSAFLTSTLTPNNQLTFEHGSWLNVAVDLAVGITNGIVIAGCRLLTAINTYVYSTRASILFNTMYPTCTNGRINFPGSHFEGMQSVADFYSIYQTFGMESLRIESDYCNPSSSFFSAGGYLNTINLKDVIIEANFVNAPGIGLNTQWCDNAAFYTVSGKLSNTTPLGGAIPATFQGTTCFSGQITAYLPQLAGPTAVTSVQATSSLSVSNGTVVGVTITGTFQYVWPTYPTVTFSAPGGGGTTATGTVVSMIWDGSPTIVGGGTGYHKGDILTGVGGTFSSALTLVVLTVDANGVALTATGANAGSYSVYPASQPMSFTGGHGTGFTANCNLWSIAVGSSSITIQGGGSLYNALPILTFPAGNSTGAALAIMGQSFEVSRAGGAWSQFPIVDSGAQTFTPTTGTTVTIPAMCADALINPAGTLAALTVQSPPAPVNAAGSKQTLVITFTHIVTTLTWTSGAGSSYGGATLPAAAAVGTRVTLEWWQTLSAWVHTVPA